MIPRLLLILPVLLGLLLPGCTGTPKGSPSQREHLLRTVERIMRSEPEWVSVHAAEVLIRHGRAQAARAFFRDKVETAGPKFRIGVWRVMARSATSAAERERYTSRIRAAFLDEKGPDRLHAIETLAKLGAEVRDPELVKVAAGTDAMASFASWCQWNMGTAGAEDSLARLAASSDEKAPYCAAYSLRHLPAISPGTLEKLKRGLARAPEDAAARGYFLSALSVHSSGSEQARFKQELIDFALGRGRVEKDELCAALGTVKNKKDAPLLWKLFNQDEPDVKVFAADALLTLLF